MTRQEAKAWLDGWAKYRDNQLTPNIGSSNCPFQTPLMRKAWTDGFEACRVQTDLSRQAEAARRVMANVARIANAP